MLNELVDSDGPDDSTTAWRHLRGLRHRAPGATSSSEERFEVFNTSLAQAEELLGAARTVGPASRPLLAFYGLSQAGRAVASAALSVGADDYELVGHGIACPRLREQLKAAPSLAEVVVRARSAGAFPVVAAALRSGFPTTDVALGDLWALLPDLAPHSLVGTGSARSLRVMLGFRGIDPALFVPEIPTTTYSIPELDEWMRLHYPTLDRWALEDEPAAVESESRRIAGVHLLPPAGRANESGGRPAGERYCGELRVFPRLGASVTASHPFMIWWALLFALSMLARYEPRYWAKTIDIAHSPDALPVELLLDRALDMVPALTLAAIRQVASSP